MASPAPYQWTPANNGTTFSVDQSSHVRRLDRAVEAQRQNEQELLVWGLSIAALFLLLVIGGTIRFRRVVAAREAERLARLFPSDQLR
jgi:hypothetical protein